MENPSDQSPFYEGHKIYTGLLAVPDSPSSTRVATTGYLFKTKEAPISGRAFLTRWKVLYSASRTDELREKINKEEVTNLRKITSKKLSQNAEIIPKTGMAFISGADTSLDIRDRKDARGYFTKKLAAFGDENVKIMMGNNNRVLVPDSSREVTLEIRNGKSPSSSVQGVIYNVFRDLIEEGNGVEGILRAIIDTGEEYDIDELVEQLSAADAYIYKNKSIIAGEELDDEALDEESRDRMMSRAAALLTAAGVLGDPPLDYDSIRFEAREQELHDAAVSGALGILKQL